MVPRHRQHRPEADRCEVPGQRWRNATSGASQTRRTGDRRGLGRRHGAEPANCPFRRRCSGTRFVDVLTRGAPHEAGRPVTCMRGSLDGLR